MPSRGARKAAQNKATKAAHAAKTKAHWDELGSGEKVGYGDIAQAAAGAIPFVGGALAVKDIAKGAGVTAGTAIGASGDAAEVAGKVGLKTIGAAAGQIAGIVGAADAAYAAGKLFNKKQYQDLTPEQQQARRTKRSGRGASRQNELRMRAAQEAQERIADSAKNIENLADPEKEDSPLTRNGFNPYAAGSYGTLSQSLDQNFATQRAEQSARREAERHAQQQEMQRFQFAELKAKQAEGLIVPGDTGYNNVNLAVDNASRALVDQAGALTGQLSKGDISADDYAFKIATIRSQVPGIKQWKETLTNNLQNYTQALTDGQLSAANSMETSDLYGSLLKDDGRFTLNVNPEGQVVFGGVTDAENPVSIPVNGINNMPKPILKQPSPWEQLKQPIKDIQSAGAEFWNGDVEEAVKGALDGVLQAGGDSALLSLAVDHYNIPLEEAKALADSPAEGYSSALEQMVEDKWVETGKQGFINDQINAEQARQFKLQEQRLADQQQAGTKALTGAQLTELRRQQEQTANQQIFNSAIQAGDLNSLQGLGSISKVKKNFFGDGWTIHMGDEKLEVNPKTQQGQQILSNILGLGVAQDQSNPLGI